MEDFWNHYWYYWLLWIFLSWLGAELASILNAKLKGQKNISDWTLSDTIRRWSAAHRWVAPITIATAAGLCWHFFGQLN